MRCKNYGHFSNRSFTALSNRARVRTSMSYNMDTVSFKWVLPSTEFASRRERIDWVRNISSKSHIIVS